MAALAWVEGVWPEAWRKQIFEVQNMETGERTCGSSCVRDSGSWHQAATVARLAFLGKGGDGHESGLPAGRAEDAFETGQDGLMEEVGQQSTSMRS